MKTGGKGGKERTDRCFKETGRYQFVMINIADTSSIMKADNVH